MSNFNTPIWELKPKLGLGEIMFGMERDAVNKLTAYGEVAVSRDSAPIPDDEATAFLRSLGFADENISGALGAQATFASSDIITDSRNNGLVLEYERSGLTEILADVNTEHLNYRGVLVFQHDPLAFIMHMATSLGETPVINESEVVFTSNCIYLFEFVVEARTSPSSGHEYAQGNPRDRSIIWRSTPRSAGADLSLYKPMSL
ncbi:hypothetical protein Rleg4DRAFT_6826 [Rhizobium leguminosarum bv. trifolii WSM2297]|uniref:Uncharacterized protein n=1 Tax=Rhizobium leguminosarum bv. trifolii WSM2297 TaxID=754762 RepID=J0CIH0_RHILT|nr:hypothetical protein [Rhizobium leguminosarum]EJC83432.1 hypothetical protein Rleg4DRAFT_5195 [Rhizobium leguminosarum bv. trifolii WSM2297]EJC84976.1 hypothetical protein Rleg4DRAFT_6826 [Rhizobium leguminosarum bv. trifolii WSM2297]